MQLAHHLSYGGYKPEGENMGNDIVRPADINLDDLQRTARLLAASNYFDAKGGDNTAIAQIATKILAGRELGYGPFASVQGIHVIQGRPALSANIMAAAVKNSPRYDYRVRKMDGTECTIEFFERCEGRRESLGISTFTVDDAKRAQVKNLDKFPRNMLFARAMSNGVRWFCPDVFSGNTVYTPDELGAYEDDGGVVVVDGSTGEVVEDRRSAPQHRQPVPVQPTPNVNGHKPVPEQTSPADDFAAVEESPFGADAVPTDLEKQAAAIIADNNLKAPPAAQAWAVASGYCQNEHEARNSWKNVVTAQFGGKVAMDAMPRIVQAFVIHQLEKPVKEAA